MESMAAVANTYALVAIDMVGLKGHDEAFRGPGNLIIYHPMSQRGHVIVERSRHRLWLDESDWRYERDFDSVA